MNIDKKYAEVILKSKTSLEAKKKSSKVAYIKWKDYELNGDLKRKVTKVSIKKNFEEIERDKWCLETQKEVMRRALLYKFSNNILKKQLLDTKNKRLEEIGRFSTEILTNKG